MRRFASFLIAPLLLTLPAHADDTSKRAKAEELIAMQHLEVSITKASENLAARMDEIAEHIAGPNPTADQQAKIDEFKKQMSQSIDTNFAWTAMRPKLVDLYADRFTEDQLDAIISFYKTPAGAAYLEKLPEINTQFNQLGTAALTNMSAQMQKSIQNLQQDLGVKPNGPVVVRAMPPANSSKTTQQSGNK